ncbi:MAG TPA: HAMP domain-containing protein, partial [Actinomycetota bacterium]|nr:HAMP domain-containing protein [Actinomycetota bacterium]
GTEGKLGGQAQVKGVSGTWKGLTENVNFMASNLTDQVRSIAQVTTAVANGDLTQKITVEAKGEVAALADTINTMVDQLSSFADEVTRVAREVGTEGKLGGQAQVEGVSGTWRGLTENVNLMASNLTDQVRNIAAVTTAVAQGDLTKKISVEAKGEVAALAETINTMVDQLSSFADEVTRVAREVGTEGKLGGQAKVEGVSGTWKGLTENVNLMASNLTDQVRDIAQVTTAVARGDLSQKITVDVKGEILELKNTINVMVDQLSSFADEVTRVAREVGTEGKLGGQAKVKGVSGTWKGLTDNVNSMASNLTGQVRNIAQVATAVAKGDLSQKITVDVQGEILELKNTINVMVDQLSSFADEVTRVAREVGTEGKLGGQAQVRGVSGTWRDLTDNVNFMAGNLTSQVRNIAQVTTAVAKGDLGKKITVDARGEILELKETINTMVDQLSSFAAEVTRVAREVGSEGKLGGQAEVEGVSGTWKGLTENVNQLAGNLTTQVRAIADVATAVTQGDLTREITVAAQGEVAQLKDKINQMITNLAETTQRNEEQDWLKTNLAKISGMMQGQRDLQTVSRLIMSELTPTVSSQHGAFFLAESADGNGTATDAEDMILKLKASYGYKARKNVSNTFKMGEGLVGQAALEKKPILITQAPQDYIKVTSGLGEAAPVNIIVVPVLFEDQVLGVIELASLRPFSDVNQTFLDQLIETLGVVLNTIIANMRTEDLLEESQRLTRELQSQSEELQTQQEELQQTNEELQEKAALLAEQNRNIEIKNQEIEMARSTLEEKAQQLALSSKYKSEFLANMSHELRTPLNSLLILAKLLADNDEQNLTEKQIEFASTIHNAGADLLSLINDILDLSKVEAGKMDVHPTDVPLSTVADNVEQSFRPVADQQSIEYSVEVSDELPATITTDEQRLQQILNNLLSNAFKFTNEGSVKVTIAQAPSGTRYLDDRLTALDSVIAFAVSDTGIGVPEDKLRLIFESFQQADGTTSRRFGGTGLGLSISREIARLLGGEIRVESEVGAGSTFTLYLPEQYVPLPVAPEPPRIELGAPMLIEAPAGTDVPSVRLAAVPDEVEAIDLPNDLDDDRNDLAESDRALLVVANPDAARGWMEAARSKQFKALGSTSADTGLAMAREFQPDAMLVDAELGEVSGLVLLHRMKLDPTTRHIPVYIATEGDQRQEAMRAGAAACVEKPVTEDALSSMLRAATYFIERGVKNLIVVEDNDVERNAIVELIGTGDDVSITAVASSEEALAEMESKHFDCMVLDLKLPDMTGFDLLEKLRSDARFRDLPIIIYTGKDLTRKEETKLRKYSDAIIIKDVNSPERLLDETSLFLHRLSAALPADRREMIEHLHSADTVFQGKKILVVDDDVRNVFALTSILETRGMEVIYAENGRDGIETLRENPDVDLVLMDIMMPEMDGYETTTEIRNDPQFAGLPIIALTAKAMKGDREKSIASGASDYITKPVDSDQLLSLMRVWLYQ